MTPEQQIAELRDALTKLVEWADHTGGWEAPCWNNAQRALEKTSPP